MAYWLFMVMHDEFPQLWATLVSRSIAAQHYPRNWPHAVANVNLLHQIRRGDYLVAGFRRQRFGGIGEVLSPLARTGRSLRMVRDGRPYAFRERLRVRWHALPSPESPWVSCRSLLPQGFSVRFHRGLCVRRIDRASFAAIREQVTGAEQLQTVERDLGAVAIEEALEGRKTARLVNTYERNVRLRTEAIRVHGLTCMACGFDYGAAYGARGHGFIEVHHLRPVGTRSKASTTNAKTDMTVLCANCHRMIHRYPDQLLSVAQLRRLIRMKRGAA